MARPQCDTPLVFFVEKKMYIERQISTQDKGNHAQEELAKSGYRSQRNLEKFKESLYFWVTCWNLLSKYGDFRIFFP
jgi:hypothetical protein